MFKTQTNHQNQNKTRQNKVRNKNFKSNRESISGSVIGSKNIQNINKSGGKLHLDGFASIANLMINHKRIANKDVVVKNAKFDFRFLLGADFISIDKKLVAINLQFTEDARSAKNIIAVVSSSFSAENITIVELMSSAPELIIIIKKDDVVKALNVIEKLQEMN